MAHTWVTRYVETKCMCAFILSTLTVYSDFMYLLGTQSQKTKGEREKEILTATRLDKHQHTGMYTAQLYAAVCDYGTVVPVTCLRSDPSDLAKSDGSGKT